MKVGQGIPVGQSSQVNKGKSTSSGQAFKALLSRHQLDVADAGVDDGSGAFQESSMPSQKHQGREEKMELIEDVLNDLAAVEKELTHGGSDVNAALKILDKLVEKAATSAVGDSELQTVVAVERERIRNLGMISVDKAS
ncbi:MAG: hypothetical protein HQM07_06510 [Zetaproteobacteria bacterium]|nr:hypothetical protein [Zetaproteobacteria bacterium]